MPQVKKPNFSDVKSGSSSTADTRRLHRDARRANYAPLDSAETHQRRANAFFEAGRGDKGAIEERRAAMFVADAISLGKGKRK